MYPACATEQLFGYVVDRTGSYRIAWLVVAAAVLIGLVSALRLREDRQR